MGLKEDLQEIRDKVEEVVAGVQSAEPTLEQKVFSAVENLLVEAGYQKPATPAPTEGTEVVAQ